MMHSRLELRQRKPQQQLSDVIYFGADATVDADVESSSVNLSSSMASAPASEPGGVACEAALEIGSVSCNINIERIDVDVAAVDAHNHIHTCTQRSVRSLSLSLFAYLSLARTDAVC